MTYNNTTEVGNVTVYHYDDNVHVETENAVMYAQSVTLICHETGGRRLRISRNGQRSGTADLPRSCDTGLLVSDLIDSLGRENVTVREH